MGGGGLSTSGAFSSSEGMYMVFQIAGGIVAGFTFFGIFNTAFNLGLTPAHTIGQTALAEILCTLRLCCVVLNAAVCKVSAGKAQFFGISIGFVVAAGFCYCLLYTVFDFTGAALAVVFYWIVRPGDEISKSGRCKGKDMSSGLHVQCLCEFLASTKPSST